MRLVTYNMLKGGTANKELLFNVIQELRADLLVVQEACDWRSGMLDEFLQKFPKYSNYVYLEGNEGRSSRGYRYDLILFSKYPIKKHGTITDPEKIWHGAIWADVETPVGLIRFFNLHLSPRSPEWRLNEIESLKLYFDVEYPVIIMGDLNSLDEGDEYPDLQSVLMDSEITKFGNPPEFLVMQKLYEYGFTSLVPFQPTVFAESADRDHLDLRLDYVLAKSCDGIEIVSTNVVDTPSTREVSDHFPVVVEIKELKEGDSSNS